MTEGKFQPDQWPRVNWWAQPFQIQIWNTINQ